MILASREFFPNKRILPPPSGGRREESGPQSSPKRVMVRYHGVTGAIRILPAGYSYREPVVDSCPVPLRQANLWAGPVETELRK